MEYHKNLSLESLFYINDDGLVCCEEWKNIVGFEDLYSISNLGRIKGKSYHNGTDERILKQNPKNGYLQIALYKNKKYFYFSVHRVVAIAFIPNPENKPDVGHFGKYPNGKEGNKKDNMYINLKWVTRSENLKHSFKFGLNNNEGIRHSQVKLTEKDVLDIRASILTNKELSVLYSICDAHICTIRKRRSWKHI